MIALDEAAFLAALAGTTPGITLAQDRLYVFSDDIFVNRRIMIVARGSTFEFPTDKGIRITGGVDAGLDRTGHFLVGKTTDSAGIRSARQARAASDKSTVSNRQTRREGSQ